jgi:hypothetical protein
LLPSYSWAAQSNYFVVVEMVARCARFARGDGGRALQLDLNRGAVARVVRSAVVLATSRAMRRLGGVDAATAFEQARWRAITALLALLGDDAVVLDGDGGDGDGSGAVHDVVAAAVVEGFENAAEATSEVLARCALGLVRTAPLDARLALLRAATAAFRVTKMTRGALAAHLLSLATHECWRASLCAASPMTAAAVEVEGGVAAAVRCALCALCKVGGVVVAAQVVERCCATLWSWESGSALERHFLREAVSMCIVGDLR